MKLLHIDSSILGQASVSRALTSEVVEAQKKLHPSLEVSYRDVAADPLQHLSAGHLAVAQGGTVEPGVDIDAGNAALEEFLAADTLVIGAPMYNFAIPSQLKAWIDRLVVAGKTFRYTEAGLEGLAGGKKILIVSSRGGSYIEGNMALMDHQESHLRGVFGFLGITDISVIRAENVARPDLRDASIEAAKQEIAGLKN